MGGSESQSCLPWILLFWYTPSPLRGAAHARLVRSISPRCSAARASSASRSAFRREEGEQTGVRRSGVFPRCQHTIEGPQTHPGRAGTLASVARACARPLASPGVAAKRQQRPAQPSQQRRPRTRHPLLQALSRTCSARLGSLAMALSFSSCSGVIPLARPPSCRSTPSRLAIALSLGRTASMSSVPKKHIPATLSNATRSGWPRLWPTRGSKPPPNQLRPMPDALAGAGRRGRALSRNARSTKQVERAGQQASNLGWGAAAMTPHAAGRGARAAAATARVAKGKQRLLSGVRCDAVPAHRGVVASSLRHPSL